MTQRGIAEGAWPKGHQDQRGRDKGAWPKGHRDNGAGPKGHQTKEAGSKGQGQRGRAKGAGTKGQGQRGRAKGAGPKGQDQRGRTKGAFNTKGAWHYIRDTLFWQHYFIFLVVKMTKYLARADFIYIRQAFYFLTLPWVIRDKTDLG